MTFDYLQRVVVDGQLEVENIGQCVLLCRNDLGEEFYLFIHTELGWTETIEYGPVVPDLQILPFSVSMQYNRFEYNQSKIEKLIDRFLNNPKRMITQAEVTDVETVRPNIYNIIDKVFSKEEIEDAD